MERKIGEIFTCDGKTYQVVKGIACDGCCILHDHCFSIRESLGPCADANRSDKTGIIFKEINNMEIKNNQLTIDIPEGMEIDLENSDLAKGIIKFRDKWLTLEQLYKNYKNRAYHFAYRDSIKDFSNNKLVAIANLMDIASYFNKGWSYDVNQDVVGYLISYDRFVKEPCYNIRKNNSTVDVYYGNPVFKNEADAQYVIDNPNFRDILNIIYKD